MIIVVGGLLQQMVAVGHTVAAVGHMIIVVGGLLQQMVAVGHSYCSGSKGYRSGWTAAVNGCNGSYSCCHGLQGYCSG